MDEHQPRTLTPTEVFREAQSIGARELRRVNGLLTVHRVAGTLINFVDTLAGRPKPGSYTATYHQEKTHGLRNDLKNTALALQFLVDLQVCLDPCGIAVAQINNEFAAAVALAPATGIYVPVDRFVSRYIDAKKLPSALPTVNPQIDPSCDGSHRLFEYALKLQQQANSMLAS